MNDMGSHLETYLQNRKTVEWMNEHNSGVTFAINETGDLTDEEYKEQLGLKMPAKRRLQDGEIEKGWCNGEGSVLSTEEKGRKLDGDLTINWV